MSHITIVTNHIPGGWHPRQLDQFLAANEETLVRFPIAMVKAGHKVDVYTTVDAGGPFEWEGVSYKARQEFDHLVHHDVLIAFKEPTLWMRNCQANIKINWSNDVDNPWPQVLIDRVDKIVMLGTYHREMMPWVPDDKAEVIPLGFKKSLFKDRNKVKKDKELCIYGTSPDRGLEQLLMVWPQILERNPTFKLVISYGWTNVDKMGGQPGQELKQRVMQTAQMVPNIMLAPNLNELQYADLLKHATYFIHPLLQNRSDLFGFSVAKAEMAGVIPVLPGVLNNGFRDITKQYIPYHLFMNGSLEPVTNMANMIRPVGWDEIVKKYWLPLIETIRGSK